MSSTRAIVVLAALLAACADPTLPVVAVPTLDDIGGDSFASVSAGGEHTCALTTAGTAFCWGSNEFGQLGVDDDGTRCVRDDFEIACRRSPVQVSGNLVFQKVAAGGSHSCGLTADYHMYCWGDNLHGELGDPTVRQSFTPVEVTGTLFMDVAVGRSHTCGLRGDGLALCWGANESGQLGIITVGLGSAIPTNVRTNQRFVSVTAGGRRSCARTSGGAAFCWGESWVATQPNGDVTRDQAQPARVGSAPAFTVLSAGSRTVCGISTTQTAHCWESNAVGSIGDGTATGNGLPQPVTTSQLFVAISSGNNQSCAIAESGHAYCWGANDSGQLGVSPSAISKRCGFQLISCSPVPVRVTGWRRFTDVSVGEGDHVCGVTIGGNVYCWGAGRMGQRGDGRSSLGEWLPVKTVSP